MLPRHWGEAASQRLAIGDWCLADQQRQLGWDGCSIIDCQDGEPDPIANAETGLGKIRLREVSDLRTARPASHDVVVGLVTGEDSDLDQISAVELA